MEFDEHYQKVSARKLDDLFGIVTPMGRKINDDDFQSDSSFVDESGAVGINEAFGNPEVETRNEFPQKGYQYMLFCFAMFIFLSALAIIDGPEQGTTVSLREIVDDVTTPL